MQPTAFSIGIRPRVFARLGRLILLVCFAVLPAALPAQTALKPRLYTTGSTLRRAFSKVTAQARKSTVQVLSGDDVVALGVIVGSDGWILTKASELDGEVSCRLPDGKEVEASVVGAHEATDLALLKVAAEALTPIEWRSGADPAVGYWVVSPGVRETPEAIGVVGTPRRRIERERVAGVLGVSLDGDDGPPRIMHVFPNSGAESAGLKVGDLVESIDGDSLSGRMSMILRVRKHNPGDSLKLSIRRDEEQLEVDVTLTPPPSDEFLSRIAIQNRMGGDLSERRTGFDAVIQHDSVLRPEECGGPAVGLDGKALGVNIARAGRTETYTLPADLILPVIEELRRSAPASTVSKE